MRETESCRSARYRQHLIPMSNPHNYAMHTATTIVAWSDDKLSAPSPAPSPPHTHTGKVIEESRHSVGKQAAYRHVTFLCTCHTTNPSPRFALHVCARVFRTCTSLLRKRKACCRILPYNLLLARSRALSLARVRALSRARVRALSLARVRALSLSLSLIPLAAR